MFRLNFLFLKFEKDSFSLFWEVWICLLAVLIFVLTSLLASEEKLMRKIIVVALIIVLSIGTAISLIANSFEENLNKVQTQSSSTPSNIIDHLPFTINTTDVYYITKDLTVNGTGITILANNVVLIGQKHTITGNGTSWPPLGVGIYAYGNCTTILDCNIENFTIGISIGDSSFNTGHCNIAHNYVFGNGFGIILDQSPYNQVFGNIIVGNGYGILTSVDSGNTVTDNYLKNDVNAIVDHGGNNKWNGTKRHVVNIVNGPYEGGNCWHDYPDNDLDGDGIGETPYQIDGNNVDYLPLVDIVPPYYDLEAFNFSSPSVLLGITWKDNVQLDKVILQLDGVNYTNSAKVSESFGFNEYYQVEHKATYASFFILPTGPHTYRWYANDTSNHWNSTQLQSFNVIQTNINNVDISKTLKVSANITCQGASNITQVMDYVNLEFKIDSNWFSMNMTYNPSTRLYSALIPEYNQLANKTIQFYVAAKTKQNQTLTSNVYIYHVPEWVRADLNRDGTVNILDIVLATTQYGKPYP